MLTARRCHPSGLANRFTEAAVALWIMMAIIFGLAAAAIVVLFAKIAG
jgi:hypothetical protein